MQKEYVSSNKTDRCTYLIREMIMRIYIFVSNDYKPGMPHQHSLDLDAAVLQLNCDAVRLLVEI